MLEASARGSREWRRILFEDVLPSLHTPIAGVDNGLKLDNVLERVLGGEGRVVPSTLGERLRLVHTSLWRGEESRLDDAIAIVEMSCRFPDANNPDELWSVLAEGRDAIRLFPSQRLSTREKADGDVPSFEAGFLKRSVDEFDARFFGMSPP